jgi:hypothetical protein
MAKVEWVADASRADGNEQIINIDGKVGAGCSNYPDDVLIVEALLAYYKELDDFAPDILITRPINIWSPNTSLLITRFQNYINTNPRIGTTLKVDGITARARGKAEWGHHRRWTIVQLNYMCDMFTEGMDYISRIRDKWSEVDKALGKHESIT